RLDGFAAWEAGDQLGELVTQPFLCQGEELFVNADARDGSVRVEVLVDGAPVHGLDANSCQSFAGDALATQKNGWVKWKSGKNLKAVAGRQVQFRFLLQNAKLYSFRVATKSAMSLRQPRATER